MPIAVMPKTRNTTEATGSQNGNEQSEGKIESKKSSRLVSNNVNSIAYTSAMANSYSKNRMAANSHVIGPNSRAFNAVFEKRMSVGRKTQEPKLAQLNQSSGGPKQATRLS